MSQITFEPALDSYHAVFRFVRLFDIIIEIAPVHVDTWRILDFYLLFPFRLEGVRFRREHTRFRAIGRSYERKRPYASLPDDRQLLERMRIFQTAAVETMAVKQVIELESLGHQQINPLVDAVEDQIAEQARTVSEGEADLMEILRALAREYPLLGADGLKARTNLLDHRYDAV